MDKEYLGTLFCFCKSAISLKIFQNEKFLKIRWAFFIFSQHHWERTNILVKDQKRSVYVVVLGNNDIARQRELFFFFLWNHRHRDTTVFPCRCPSCIYKRKQIEEKERQRQINSAEIIWIKCSLLDSHLCKTKSSLLLLKKGSKSSVIASYHNDKLFK